jgi:hypothetical protein
VRRYVSPEEDSARWDRFEFRPGDVVVSTRSKSGTTWVQLICAVLVHGTPDLPAPLGELSPWLDHTVRALDDVLADLDAQRHRRVVKTHTPLDGVPLDDRATYVVVARHPLDLALSLYHQGDNVDRARVAALTGVPAPPAGPRPAPHEWLLGWTRTETTPQEQLDSLVGVLHHVRDAWDRRHDPRVLLVHYADLLADLDGQVRRIAARLGVEVAEEDWPRLVRAATWDSMRARADRLVPDTSGVLKDPRAFFRSGTSGGGRALLTGADLAAYEDRVAALAPPDLLAWLQR